MTANRVASLKSAGMTDAENAIASGIGPNELNTRRADRRE